MGSLIRILYVGEKRRMRRFSLQARVTTLRLLQGSRECSTVLKMDLSEC